MSARRFSWVLLPLLAIAAYARFTGLDWDGGIGAHPDERYIVGVADALRWPDRMSPFSVDPAYAYGHLPVYLLWLAKEVAPAADPLHVGRALAAACDLCTVGITFALGRLAFGRTCGTVGAALVGLMVLHVQNAHYTIADVPLAMFTAACLACAMRVCRTCRWRDGVAAGAAVGLAAASKITGLLLLLPLAIACALGPGGRRQAGARFIVTCAAAGAAFCAASPFALLSLPTFARNVMLQSAIARGTVDVPYTRQYHGTLPFVYPALQQLRWGMGWIPGLVALGGLAQAAVRVLRRRCGTAEWVLAAWVFPYSAFVGALYAKFPRYVLPLSPILAVYAGRLLAGAGRPGEVRQRPAGTRHSALPARRASRWRTAAALTVIGATAVRCVGFVGIYSEPHPWIEATRWFGANPPVGATVAVEEWDHPLPVAAAEYELVALPVFDEESPGKWEKIADGLSQADYVVVASQRGYGALARWPERYAATGEYYRLLFSGALGFEPAACFRRSPRVGPVSWGGDPTRGLGFALPAVCSDDRTGRDVQAGVGWQVAIKMGRLDESFTVYDQPTTVVFRRAGASPATDMLQMMGGAGP